MSIHNLQLDEILASYPSQDEPHLQSIVSRKQEFSELRAEGREPRPRPGEYMLHQQFVARFMRAFNKLLLFHATGSGKTCSIVAAAKWFIEQRKKGGNIKKILYLVPGPTLKEEVARQIACSCSRPDEYLTSSKSRSGKSGRESTMVKAKIRKDFKIIAYRSFVQKFILSKITSYRMPRDRNDNEEMERWRLLVASARREIYEQFSDTLIVLDEPQTVNVLDSRADLSEEQRFDLRSERKSRRERRARNAAATQIVEYEDINLIEQRGEAERRARAGRESGKSLYIDHEDVYDELWLLLHNVVRSKVMIATATPMTGEVEEIRTLMNLLLDREKQIPFNLDLQGLVSNPDPSYGLSVMRPYFEGCISYVRSLETGVRATYMRNLGSNHKFRLEQCAAFPLSPETEEEKRERELKNRDFKLIDHELEGHPYPGSGVREAFIPLAIIYRSLMSPYQNDCYHTAKDVRETELSEDMRAQGLQVDARHASNFVFPPNREGDGLWGRKGFRYWVENHGDSFRAKTNVSYDKENDSLDTINLGAQLQDIESIRYYSCKYASIVEICASNPGSDFVYGEFKVGSGLIALALCFEAIGFEMFRETDSVFLKSAESEGKDFCGGGNSKIRRIINPAFPKKCRYALLTPETSKYHDAMRELFNSYENRHGEYIKVIMVSPTAQIGLSFNSILRGHLIGSEWTESANYQALSRFIRATSHEYLLREAEARGDIAPVIEVQIYQHCAVPWHLGDERDPNSIVFERGIDEEMYYASELKDRRIKKMERWMKQCAVDCVINKAKNQRPEDRGKDGSQQCDYQSCAYTCVDEPIDPGVDVTTYDVYYTDQVVDRVIMEYRRISHVMTYFTIETMYARFPNVRQKFIDIALERMVYNKLDFLDNFGYPCYLVEDEGNFYLTRTFPTASMKLNYHSSYYANNLIALTELDMSTIAFSRQEETQEELVQNITAEISAGRDVAERMANVNIEYQVKLLEDAISRSLTKPDPQDKGILDLYRPYYFSFYEPLTEIKKDRDAASRPKKGRPKSSTSKEVVRVNPNDITLDTSGEKVYAHFLYGKDIAPTKYGEVARYIKAQGEIRILKPSEEVGWRGCSGFECAAYNRVLQKLVYEQMQRLGRSYYGIYDPQHKVFRIVDKTKESPDAFSDTRKESTGLNCDSARLPTLAIILYELGYRPVIPPKEDQTISILRDGKLDPGYFDEKAISTIIQRNRDELKKRVSGKYPNRAAMMDFLTVQITNTAGSPAIEEILQWSDEKILYVSSYLLAQDRKILTKNVMCPLIQTLFTERNEIMYI